MLLSKIKQKHKELTIKSNSNQVVINFKKPIDFKKDSQDLASIDKLIIQYIHHAA